MTLNEFFEKLADHKGEFEFFGKLVRNKCGQCPILAVANRRDGLVEAYLHLGLSREDADFIIVGADYPGSWLRARMLAVLGLEEKS